MMQKFEKQPYEEFFISAGFQNNMAGAETLLGSEVTATDKNGDEDATVIDPETISVDGAWIKVRVCGGDVDLSPYKITFRAVTSTGNKWELDVQMRVREI